MSGALVAEGLVKRFGRRRVVDGVSLDVRPGEVVGLLGPNGAGKTTSFNLVVGFLRPDAGRVSLDGQDLSALAMHQRARLGLGYLPQESTLFRKLTVRQNLEAVLELKKGLDKAERARRAQKMVSDFHLEKVAETKGELLSGGERRRAEIARSLLAEPRFLLFDEPFAGIDPITIHELQAEIRALRDRGLGVLITDHNVRDTLRICDRAYIIADGRIFESGTPTEIAASDKARRVYLGSDFSLS